MSLFGFGKASQPPGLQDLIAMGFPETSCRDALSRTDNNLERAVALLLNPPPAATPTVVDMTRPSPSATSSHAHSSNSEDEDLKLAIALSKQEASSSKPTSVKSAAVRKSGTAALQRFSGQATTTNSSKIKSAPVASHPSVKVPSALSSKPFLEQITRSCNRLSPSSLAVDTLLKTLTTIRANPTSQKYRRIDMSSPGFKRALSNVPGCVDLLTLGIGFQKSSQPNIYTLQYVDAARLYAAIEFLTSIKSENYDYNLSRMKRLHDAAINKIIETEDMTELNARAEITRKTPNEPDGYGCSIVTLIYKSSGEKISRKFASDDVLHDVYNWIAGNLGTKCLDKIQRGELIVLSKNQFPKERVGGEEWGEAGGRTLQSVGLWPSGECEMVGKEVWEMEGEDGRKQWETKRKK
ncbi:hypothetical protein TrVE_jg8795 [Triparma verrucosa]|uniref:UBA domain-containing protein n=1 Tax=Triparma verrucosa TaxID=1606542 RepID=A0A9W7C537_9STRA|nr:hypothetical protein TrVE_jg8795 [Triparma verrucosa]